MSDLHGQDLVNTLDETTRIAAGKPGQEGADNIEYRRLRDQINADNIQKKTSATAGNVPIFTESGDIEDSGQTPGEGGGGHTIQDEGTPLTQRTNLNFVGDGVTATDDAGNDATVVTINGGASSWDELTDTFNKASNAKKIAKISDDELTVEPTNYDFDQVVNTSDIDVSDPTWQESESRLLEVKKVAGEATFEGATQLIDIFAPPGIDASLLDQSGWSDEAKILTGENFLGELGKVGQLRVLADGTICRCIGSTQGTNGGADGSATYRRNRAVDTLDPDNNTQDDAVCDLLDPARTGGNTDDGWDLVTNIKIISTIPARLGTWWKVAGGYSYFCYAVNGSSYYWFRSGQPAAIYRYITTTSHPTLTTNLLAHDFGVSVYTEVGGDEISYHDQVFYNLATREYFVKVNTTQWEKLR